MSELTDPNITEETRAKQTKKYVFQAYDDNIVFMDSLSADNKNTLLNQLLHNHRNSMREEKQNKSIVNFFKTTIITILIVVIGIPLFIRLINFSFDVTVNSYSVMEKNFEKLFD